MAPARRDVSGVFEREQLLHGLVGQRVVVGMPVVGDAHDGKLHYVDNGKAKRMGINQGFHVGDQYLPTVEVLAIQDCGGVPRIMVSPNVFVDPREYEVQA